MRMMARWILAGWVLALALGAWECLGAAGPASTPGFTTGKQSMSASNWVWMATAGNDYSTLSYGDGFSGFSGSAMGLWLSSDGTNWSRAGSALFYNPSQYTNAPFKVNAGRFVLLNSRGQWWGANPHDRLSLGGLAQGIDLWRSSDLTNWCRETVLYPMGQSNVCGRLFEANWFKDNNNDIYLTFTYGTNCTGGTTNSIYCMKSNDGTLTNWGAAVAIKDTDVTQEGLIVRPTDGIYRLYYRCKWPGLEWLLATNSANNLTSLFTPCQTNLGWGTFGASADSGGLSLVNVGGTHWRAYTHTESGVTSQHPTNELYLDSLDDLATWSANWQLLTVTNFHGQGIVYGPTAVATNAVYNLGETNQGQVRVRPPILLANSVQAADGIFRNGLVAGSVYAPGSITTGDTLQGGGLVVRNNGTGQSNVVDLAVAYFLVASANFVIDAAGNIQSGAFIGDGAQLTGLDGGNISAGTVALARTVWGSYSNYTTAATARTMNTYAGKVNLSAGQTTYTVTDSLVAATSAILATVNTADATATFVRAIPGSGSFTLVTTATTGNTSISWWLAQP